MRCKAVVQDVDNVFDLSCVQCGWCSIAYLTASDARRQRKLAPCRIRMAGIAVPIVRRRRR